ncbi:MAG: CDP-alcohol phosphatidyltransferase family protein [Oscillospiraceae bacterium]|nr:CDP-alcohol phosphatidyltransferase family protein [Oscillospiraceae bacterium]MBQ7129533.1 CDP-alcohol phosphatidyltransferase family protein [Oscillospiraceae bacterium]
MFIKNWKTEILTIPNLLSLFRLVLIPVYVYIYLNAVERHQFYLAGMIMAVSCLTDAVDGKIARHFNMVSTVGKILDPLADKVTQFTLTLCLSLKYPVLNPVLVLFVIKEAFQAVVGLVYLRRGRMLPGALMAGKICTTVLFVSLITLVLFPDMNPALVDAIAMTDGLFLMISFISYILAYYGKNAKVQDVNME